MPIKFFQNCCLVFCSTYIPLLIFSAIDFFSKENPLDLVEKRVKNEDIVQKINAIEKGISPTFYPDIILNNKSKPTFFPLGSLPNTKSFLCNEGYGLITYNTDKFGFRNSNKNWEIINKGPNVFLIGDSFMHGSCVNDRYTISSNIAKSMRINTINLGMAGNNHYNYNAILMSIIEPILSSNKFANKVVLTFYPNDNTKLDNQTQRLLNKITPIIEFHNEKGIVPNKKYINNQKKFIEDNFPNSTKERVFEVKKNIPKWKFKRFPLYSIFSLYPIRNRIGLINLTSIKKEAYASSFSVSEDAISYLKKICQSPCKPYVAYIPNSSFWEPIKYAETYKQKLLNISKTNKIKFIDGDLVIDKNSMEDYAPKGGHLSIEGYRKMASLIKKYLKN